MDYSRKPPTNFTGESLSKSECRRQSSDSLYFLETEMRRNGMADKRLLYEEERDLYHFTDGVFAFSREFANWAELKRRGMLD